MTTGDKILNLLRAYDLKRDGDGQYRANAPYRPGSNARALTFTIDTDGEHGAFDDKTHGESGSLYELADLLGIDRPESKRTEVASTKRAYSDLAEYAAAHGLTAADLKAVGWNDVSQYQNRAALMFKTANGVRYRFIDGNEPPYKSELNYKSCWYGLPTAIRMAKEQETALVLCNGEVSTVAAQKAGIPACCVTGGEKAIPKHLLDSLAQQWQGNLWIAMDCDDTGRRASADIGKQLPQAIAIDLGLSEKGDLADFAMLYVDGALAALAAKAVFAPKLETQMSDVELLSSALFDVAKAVRRDENAALDLPTVVANARAQLDRMTMKLARPIVRSFKELAEEQQRTAMERADAVLNGSDQFLVEGLRSNFVEIDKRLGGFRPEMYVVYGATGMGKSFLMASFAREFVKQAPGFIVSTEMQPGTWLRRLVGSIAGVSASDIRTGIYKSRDAARRVMEAFELLKTMDCHILDHSSPTPGIVRAGFMDGLDKGYGYEWLIVDSASKMTYPGAVDIYNRTSGVANGLQDLYRETNLPVFATTQIGRDVAGKQEGQKMPQLEDGYGGGVIEQNAGVVLGLYNHNYYVKRGLEKEREDIPDGIVLARLLKARDEDDSDAPIFRLNLVAGAGFYELKTETKYFDQIIEEGLNSK